MPFYTDPGPNPYETGQGTGNLLLNVLMRKKIQERQRQQAQMQALQQQRLAAEIPSLEAQTAYHRAQTGKAEEDTRASADQRAMGETAGRAVQLRDMMSSGALADPQKQAVLGQIAEFLTQQGEPIPVGDKAYTTPGQSIADMLSAIARGQMARSAVTSPASAAQMMQGQKVRPGESIVSPTDWSTVFSSPAVAKPQQPEFVSTPFGPMNRFSGEVTPMQRPPASLTPGEEVNFVTKFADPEFRADPNIGPTWTNMVQRLQGSVGGGAAAPGGTTGGKLITDKSGKRWIYKGNMPDPTQDKNEANWEEAK